MNILLLGKGAGSYSVARNLALTSNLFYLSSYKNKDLFRIANKSFIWSDIDKRTIALYAIKENIDLAYLYSNYYSHIGVYEELTKIGIDVIGPSKEQLEHSNKLNVYKIAQKEKITIPPYYLSKEEIDFSFSDYRVSNLAYPFESFSISSSQLKERSFEDVLFEPLLDGIEFSIAGFYDGRNISYSPPMYVTRRAYEGNFGGYGKSIAGFYPFMITNYIKSSFRAIEKILKYFKDYKGPFTANFLINKNNTYLLDFRLKLGTIESILVSELLITPLSIIFNKIISNSCKGISYSSNYGLAKFALPDGYPYYSRETNVSINFRELWKRNVLFMLHDAKYINDMIYTSKNRPFLLFAKGLLEDSYNRIEDSFKYIKGSIWHRKDVGKKEIINSYISKIKKWVL